MIIPGNASAGFPKPGGDVFLQSILPVVIGLTRGQKRWILTACDVALAPIAVFLSLAFQRDFHAPIDLFSQYFVFVVLLSVAAAGFSLWSGASRMRLGSFDGGGVKKSALLAICLGVTSGMLVSFVKLDVTAGFHFVLVPVYFLLNIGSRLAMIAILMRVYDATPTARRIAIYGAGKTGTQLAWALRQDRDIVVVGFFDDDPSLQGEILAGRPIWHGHDTKKMCKALQVSEVLLAIPSASYAQRNAIAQRIEDEGIDVKSLPSFLQLIDGQGISDKLISFPTTAWLGRAQHTMALTSEADEYSGRTILVSGAGGSIGSELCRQVQAYGPAHIILLDNCEYALFRIERELQKMAEVSKIQITQVLGTVTDENFLETVFEQYDIDVVLHAAAYKHVTLVEQNPLAGINNNVLGTHALMRAAVAAAVRRFVLVSTDKAVRPKSVMGATKRMAELLIQDQATRSADTVFSIVRFGNVLGSSGSVVPIFREQIASGGPVMLTNEHATRYFMTIQEAAQLVLRAGGLANGGEVFVLDMGEPVLVGDLARQMIEAAGCTLRDAENPNGDIEIHITGLRPGEKMHEELIVSEVDVVSRNEKILCVRETALSELEVASTLKALREYLQEGDVDRAVSELRTRVARPACVNHCDDDAGQES